MPEVVRPSSSVKKWDRETDVLVVGLGCAGACAALEAAAAGVRVLALERTSGGGGTSAMSGGVLYLGGGTPIQEACGFDDSPEEMAKYLLASCGPNPDESKIRPYCEESVSHYHWLTEQGVPFKPAYYADYSGEPPNTDGLVASGSEYAWPFCEIARPAPRGHCPEAEGAAGGFLMQKLVAAVERSSAEIATDARAQLLVQDPDGSIAGVVVRIAGEEHCIRAKRGVILTTGGFINDDAMIEANAPLVRKCKFRVGAEGDDGSGIRMGLGAGGAVIHLDHASISLPIIPPRAAGKGLLVDARGQRFINEDAYYGRLGEYALYRADGRAWLVFDDVTFVRPEHERELAAVGETVDELERELGIPEGALQSTLALYNRYAKEGRDPLHHKAPEYVTPLETPPYGAFDCTTENSLYAAFTLGGLHTNASSEVLTPQGEVIPRLYAAGRATSGLAAPGYSSGLSLGDGSFFGRCAGREAAALRD